MFFNYKQDLSLQSEVPQPGSLVCTLQKNHENKIAYRGRVLDVSTTQGTTRAKVFAIDFGFTAIVPGDAIYSVPASLVEYPPQVSLCCLAGVQAPPENASVLEYAVGKWGSCSVVYLLHCLHSVSYLLQ